MARRVEMTGDSRLLGRGCKPDGNYGRGYKVETNSNTNLCPTCGEEVVNERFNKNLNCPYCKKKLS